MGNVLTPQSDRADGYSFWGSVNPPARFSLFTRYDHASLSKDINPPAKDVHYYNAGVQYDLIKGFQLALKYKHIAAATQPPLVDAKPTTPSRTKGH